MTENIIQVQNISKKYNLYEKPQDRFKEAIGLEKKKSLHREFYALNDVSFDVRRGETVGIIGTNGAGKSTLLKIITGVLKPSSGKIEVNGKVSALLELGAGFNQEYTGMENIFLNGRMMGFSREEMQAKVDNIVEFADIGDFIYQPVKMYSSGMFARLAFAVAINVEPDILIVDEALSVGDVFFQNKCFKKFEDLRSKGITILFVSHDIASVRQMCSRVLWIDSGQEKIFDNAEKVCDMYMDEKRMAMNENATVGEETKYPHMYAQTVTKSVKYPKIENRIDRFGSQKLEIISAFIQDQTGQNVNTMYVDQKYTTHVVFKLHEDMDQLICGFSFENNKGLPLYDINNFINQQEQIKGKKGDIIEVVYDFKLPRIMKGLYLVCTAIAQGSQENHVMLTWLHSVMQIEVVNRGFNSSYIEIPSEIRTYTHNEENVELY